MWAMLTGDMINAEQALNLGLANKTAKPEELMDVAMKVAKKIAAPKRKATRKVAKKTTRKAKK